MSMINFQDYYSKLANKEQISEDEIQALLKAYKVAISLAGYLASCHAANAERLPSGAPLSAKKRQWSICNIAALGLEGQVSGRFDVYRSANPDGERDRCVKICEELGHQIRSQEEAANQKFLERKAAKEAAKKAAKALK